MGLIAFYHQLNVVILTKKLNVAKYIWQNFLFGEERIGRAWKHNLRVL
jgi:hypothetical protein